MRSVTFIRGWQGRAVGQTDSRLSPGVMATLVQHGVARYADAINDVQPQQQPEQDNRRERQRKQR